MIIAALTGAVAVAAGAFGAHYIKDLLSPSRFNVYETGARYMLVHAAVLFVAAYIHSVRPHRLLAVSCVGFLLGIVAFSGSLLVLALTGIRWLGAVAPIGGAGFIAGWLLLALAAWKSGASSTVS